MTITVKHTKVSTVPDTTDTSLVRPSDWNADHTLVGVGTAASLDAGVANGVATLDSAGKVPVSQIPQLGDLNYQGSWNASTNTPTLTSSVGTKGYYYVVSVAGTTNLNGITDWQIGDWAVFNGSIWQKIDNTDAVTSVNGYTGTVVLTQPDIAGTVPTSRTISTGTGLTGGGDLSANRTISFSNSNVATWANTPTSANLAAAVTDETGSGSLVFGTAPTLSAPVIDGANPYIQFNNGSAVTVAAGRLWYDGSTGSWNAGMGGGNITQQIGEELFVYGKATSAISGNTLVQAIYQTGTVGASGAITFGTTVAGITNGDLIIGVATEDIALNGFGRITSFGVIHGVNTSGSTYGETWANGDALWYNPVTGGVTNVKPVAPNIKVQLGTVINAGSGGSGSLQVEISHGSVLGGTDSNVQLTSPSNGNILTYDGTNAYWKNTDIASGTAISVTKSSTGVLTVTNTLPDKTVAITGAGTTTVTGTYPNFTVTSNDAYVGTVTSVSATGGTGISVTGSPITSSGTLNITNTAPDQVVAITGAGGTVVTGTYPNFTITTPSGTVTSVSGTAPIASTGGATPTISISQATTSTNGYLSSTDWNTFNNKQPAGTYVNSVSATSPITSTGGVTPTIAMPAATGSVNGYLTSTDWTTFNSKAPATTYTSTYVPFGQGTTTPNQSSTFTYDGTTLNAPAHASTNGITVNSATVSTSYSIPTGSNGLSAGPVSVASGITVTVPTGSTWVIV